MICVVCNFTFQPDPSKPQTWGFMVPEGAGDQVTNGAEGGICVSYMEKRLGREVRLFFIPRNLCSIECFLEHVQDAVKQAKEFYEDPKAYIDGLNNKKRPDPAENGASGAAKDVLAGSSERFDVCFD